MVYCIILYYIDNNDVRSMATIDIFISFLNERACGHLDKKKNEMNILFL